MVRRLGFSPLQGQSDPLRTVKEEWVEFGGKQLYLGRVLHVFNNAMVASVEAVQKQIDDSADPEGVVVVRFAPAGDNRVSVHYIDWMMPQESTRDNERDRDCSNQSKDGNAAE